MWYTSNFLSASQSTNPCGSCLPCNQLNNWGEGESRIKKSMKQKKIKPRESPQTERNLSFLFKSLEYFQDHGTEPFSGFTSYHKFSRKNVLWAIITNKSLADTNCNSSLHNITLFGKLTRVKWKKTEFPCISSTAWPSVSL